MLNDHDPTCLNFSVVFFCVYLFASSACSKLDVCSNVKVNNTENTILFKGKTNIFGIFISLSEPLTRAAPGAFQPFAGGDYVENGN